MNFTAIDFETANEKPYSVCSLGIVTVQNGTVIDRRYRLIRPPEMRFTGGNIAVHGIYPHEVENEPEFYRYWQSIKSLLDGRMVVAHNAEFDIGVLKSVLDIYSLEYPRFEYLCSVRIARRTWKSLSSYSLSSVGNFLGCTFKHHHALEDAEMCAQIVIRAGIRQNVSCIGELCKSLNLESGHFAPGAMRKTRSLP